jgi:hypothetical protein
MWSKILSERDILYTLFQDLCRTYTKTCGHCACPCWGHMGWPSLGHELMHVFVLLWFGIMLINLMCTAAAAAVTAISSQIACLPKGASLWYLYYWWLVWPLVSPGKQLNISCTSAHVLVAFTWLNTITRTSRSPKVICQKHFMITQSFHIFWDSLSAPYTMIRKMVESGTVVFVTIGGLLSRSHLKTHSTHILTVKWTGRSRYLPCPQYMLDIWDWRNILWNL